MAMVGTSITRAGRLEQTGEYLSLLALCHKNHSTGKVYHPSPRSSLTSADRIENRLRPLAKSSSASANAQPLAVHGGPAVAGPHAVSSIRARLRLRVSSGFHGQPRVRPRVCTDSSRPGYARPQRRLVPSVVHGRQNSSSFDVGLAGFDRQPTLVRRGTNSAESSGVACAGLSQRRLMPAAA